jgi:prepilin-type N-terminal cleavage/methylation domain-containing protein
VGILAGPLLKTQESRAAIAASVLTLEVLLGLSWLACRRPPPVLLSATVGVFLAFSAALVVLWSKAGNIGCGCLGALAALAPSRADLPLALARNFGVVLICLALWPARPQAAPSSDDSAEVGPDPARLPGRSAFTLIELLASISILSILIALSVPAMRFAKEGAKGIVGLSNQRQALAAVFAYGHDEREGLPFLGTPGRPDEPVRFGNLVLSSSYFTANSRSWPSLLAGTYVTQNAIFRPVHLGWDTDPRIVSTPLAFTHGAAAAPEYWRADEPSREQHFRGARFNEIDAPEAKGLLLDLGRGAFSPSSRESWIAVGWADGAAYTRPWTPGDALDFQVIEKPAYGAIAWPVLSTRDGLAGRDR